MVLLLSVVDYLGKLNGRNDDAVLVNSHVARSDFVNENYLAVIVAELKLDIPKVKAEGFEIVSNDLGNLESLSLSVPPLRRSQV